MSGVGATYMYISLKDFFFELGVRIIKIHLRGRYIVCFKVANISLWINTGMNIKLNFQLLN